MGDAYTIYWMRQVTVRLRREICWCWNERGVSDSKSGMLPPLVDKVSASLDMSRYWEEKNKFFQTDVTAKYLTDQLNVGYPVVKHFNQGSFGWIINKLNLDDSATFVLALGLIVAFDNAVGSVVAVCLNDPARIHPNLSLAQKLWDHPEQILTLADTDHPLFRYGLLQQIQSGSYSSSLIDWDSPITVPSLIANQLLLSNDSLPHGLIPINNNNGEDITLTNAVNVIASRINSSKSDLLRIVPVRGAKDSAFLETVRAIAKTKNRKVVEFKGNVLSNNNQYMASIITFCWLKDMDLFIDQDLTSVLTNDKQCSDSYFLPFQSIPITIFLAITARSQLSKSFGHLLLPIVDVNKLSYHERIAYWKKVLGVKARGMDKFISE